ncbi:hypothetical protein [Maritimibacter alkaliphilus]|uniref:hypothetical protein n=1 Tax=Maritimibacter alkaliphilus TaxID=404236 RepID=UPI001C975C9B|nr:hypothetical protein [Maritimibacter alkaliphilus]MBY6091050.1 hypothetical protein [Maritimibacter alkaliphilus]
MSSFDAVVSRMIEGAAPRDIAAELNLSVETVYHYASQGRKQGLPIPHRRGGARGSRVDRIAISKSLMTCLSAQSAARGMTESELANRILEAVVFDRIVDAVLDDGARHA